MAAALSLAPTQLWTDLTTPRSTSGNYCFDTWSVDYLLRMLRDEVLPEIQAVLGPRRWQRCIFQQVWLLNLFFLVPNSDARTALPSIPPTLRWTSSPTSLGIDWCLAGAGEEWTGRQIRLISHLAISGCMVTWRLLNCLFNNCATEFLSGPNLQPNASHTWRAPPACWRGHWRP